MKDVRFFDTKSLNAKEVACYLNKQCSECNSEGNCTACKYEFDKISNG